MQESNDGWTVKFSPKAARLLKRLPAAILPAVHLLVSELEQSGPRLTRWRNYGPLVGKKNLHHCHLNGGKPRYVAVWRLEDREIRILEIIYVGTHEGARYDRMD